MITVKIKGDILKDFRIASDLKKKKVMDELITKLADATPVDTGTARDGWHIEGSKIVNNVDYIDRLNDGSSKQAPSHFIEKTLLAQEGVSPSGTTVRSK